MVSVVAPCRNESAFIENFIENLLKQDFPSANIEYIIVDGMSQDGTRDILKGFQSNIPQLRVIDNPDRNTPAALNRGIKAARGKYIVRMDVHSSYPKDYISQLIYYKKKLDADNVGGIFVPQSNSAYKTFFGDAIQDVLQSTFGVGNSPFRIPPTEIREVDTVPYGCYSRELFEKIGLFHPKLYRNQDYEFNQRIRQSGGKIFLIPWIKIYYHFRNRLKDFLHNNFQNGLWAPLTIFYTGNFSNLGIRHIIPFLFSFYILTLPLFLSLSPVFGMPLIIYVLLNLYFSFKIALKCKNLIHGIKCSIVFFLLHFCYGLGSLVGIIRILQKILVGEKHRDPTSQSFFM
ncbi:MAG: glycosyltransferase family 2 protein [Promethearchaeota archaeon]